MLYAGDRLESKPQLESELAEGKTIVADRYIASNLAHQGARMPPDQRAAFLRWLKQLEYEIYSLPHEDLVVYLRVPPAEAQQLVTKKGKREYTQLERDIQEASIAHLEAASAVYDELAQQPDWVTIECFDTQARKLRTPMAIHKDVVAAVGVARASRALCKLKPGDPHRRWVLRNSLVMNAS